jgi:hypothetical protein
MGKQMSKERNVYNEVTRFGNAAYKADGNNNFLAGVYESVLINALEQLPKAKREVLLDRLINIDTQYFNKGEINERVSK